MNEPVWQQLAAASAAVAHAPVWQLSDTDLVETLRAEQVAEAQRIAGRLALLRELDVRGYAAGLSFTSTQAWLSHELLINRTTAAADVRAARQLDPVGDVLPAAGALVSRLLAGEVALAATGRALVEGSISRAHADAVSICIRALPVPEGASVVEVDDLREQAEAALLAECAVGAGRRAPVRGADPAPGRPGRGAR